MFIDPKRIPPTGSLQIDAEHERLALVINEAYDLWSSGEEAALWLDVLETFLDMLVVHFKDEEETAASLGYGDVGELRAAHEHYSDLLRDFVSQCRRGEANALSPADLFTHFDRLLYEHELMDDQGLWEIFKKSEHRQIEGEPLIAWSDAFLVGEENVDRQHQTLVKMLNELHDKIVRRCSLDEIVTLLGNVRHHVEWHFKFEESLMAKNHIRELASHATLHHHLLADLDGVVHDVASRRYEELEGLLANYLKYWLLDHIAHVDVGMGQELAKKRDAALAGSNQAKTNP